MTGWAPSPGGPVTPPRIRPGSGGYVLGGILLAVAVIGGIVILSVTLVRSLDKVEDFERVSVPGQGTVEITDTGGYTLYHEFPGAASNDTTFGDRSSLCYYEEVTLTDPNGQVVALSCYSTNVDYDRNGREGVALYSFDADVAGTYTVESSELTGTVAVGRGISEGIFGGVLFGVLFGLVLFIVGVALIIVTAVRRGKAKRAAGPPLPPPGGWSPPGGPGGWGAPPPGAGPPPSPPQPGPAPAAPPPP